MWYFICLECGISDNFIFYTLVSLLSVFSSVGLSLTKQMNINTKQLTFYPTYPNNR